MITIKRYVRAESLEQAYELNQKRANRILGGMLWMKMSKNAVQNAIDLSDVVSAEISEQEDAFVIGAMTVLRTLETHEGLNRYTDGAVRESLRHIVGVQFRNSATIGGSVYGRFGFSDVLTMLLALDVRVELYKGGIIPLETYAEMPYDTDIIVNIIIRKTPMKTAYLSSRNSKSDFPVSACAVSFRENERRVVIGARPQKAMIIRADDDVMKLADGDPEKFSDALAAQVQKEVKTSGNMRASAEYRRHLAKILAKRASMQILKEGGTGLC
ncbi:FAD binding domain-containing protein [Novisyntrophococcus fermenticellae]|uniref:FAD binding domain-containing protein n=1 Tax=Novisyntrophococcus fermenticellae TaxID=2068655 RepID=UPI001E50AC38|nr:FAD binding domain-containing protein [Novisyntrophococcus fermenticellae]